MTQLSDEVVTGIGFRLVHCDEISDKTHEITEILRDDGLIEVNVRRRSKWERFKRSLRSQG